MTLKVERADFLSTLILWICLTHLPGTSLDIQSMRKTGRAKLWLGPHGQHFVYKRSVNDGLGMRVTLLPETTLPIWPGPKLFLHNRVVNRWNCYGIILVWSHVYCSIFSGESSFITGHYLSVRRESKLRQASDIPPGNECTVRCDITWQHRKDICCGQYSTQIQTQQASGYYFNQFVINTKG